MDLGKVYRFVDDLFKNKIIGEGERSHLINNGSRSGILYGAPKVHKRPLCALLSTTKSYNYFLSKLLVTMLSPQSNDTYSVEKTPSHMLVKFRIFAMKNM